MQQQQTKEHQSEKDSPFTKHLKFLEEHPEMAFSTSQNIPEDRPMTVSCLCSDYGVCFVLLLTCLLYLAGNQIKKKNILGKAFGAVGCIPVTLFG